MSPTRRQFLVGAAGLVGTAALIPTFTKCEPADPQPANIEVPDVVLEPAKLWGPHVPLYFQKREKVYWAVHAPRPGVTPTHRQFMLATRETYLNERGIETVEGHVLYETGGPWLYPTQRGRCVEVWAKTEHLPDSWRELPLYIFEYGSV